MTKRGAARPEAPTIWKRGDPADRFIFVRDAAGPFVKGFGEAFYRPFRKATGIRAIRVTGGIEPTGMIKAMVERKRYDWNVAVISKASHLQLVADGAGFLEEIGLDTPAIRSIPRPYRSAHFIGSDVYANVIAYRKAAFARRAAPQSWADFWNVAKFPGRRSLRKHPIDTLEEALLADGVKPAQLYPLDVERGFRSLDRIHPHIAIWWSGAAQQVHLLTSGKIDLCAISSIRAQKAADEGVSVGVGWRQNIRTCEGWVIPKGTPKLDLCRAFIGFAADAQRQAVVARHVNSSPAIPGAVRFIDAERAAMMPDAPAHRRYAVESGAAFWSREKDRLIARFDSWFNAKRNAPTGERP